MAPAQPCKAFSSKSSGALISRAAEGRQSSSAAAAVRAELMQLPAESTESGPLLAASKALRRIGPRCLRGPSRGWDFQKMGESAPICLFWVKERFSAMSKAEGALSMAWKSLYSSGLQCEACERPDNLN